MPNITTADVFNEARALLNDVSSAQFTDNVLLPYLKRAYEDLQQEFILNEINWLIWVSSPTTVNAGVTSISLTDEYYIIHVEEKGPTDTGYQDMYPVDFIPERPPGPFLVYYAWRGVPDAGGIQLPPAILFPAANQNRIVRYYAFKGTSYPGVGNTLMHSAKPYLAARTAFYATLYIQQNERRAQRLDADASRALDKLVRIGVKSQQGLPVRQIGYGNHSPQGSLLPWR